MNVVNNSIISHSGQLDSILEDPLVPYVLWDLRSRTWCSRNSRGDLGLHHIHIVGFLENYKINSQNLICYVYIWNVYIMSWKGIKVLVKIELFMFIFQMLISCKNIKVSVEIWLFMFISEELISCKYIKEAIKSV